MNLSDKPCFLVDFTSESPHTRFLIAARSGTIKDLQRALADGANPLAYDARDDEHKDALLRAVGSNEDPDVAEFLIDLGLDRVERSHLDNTLLHALASRKSLDRWVELLGKVITRGADVNANTAYGTTPLMRAAQVGNDRAAKLLLARGAAVRHQDHQAREALHYARHASAVRILVEAGADVNCRDDNGCTPLIEAARQGNYVVGEALIALGADVEMKRLDGSTALLDAARYGHPEVLATLLRAGADISAVSHVGETADALAENKPATSAVLGSWRARGALQAASRRPSVLGQ